MKYFVFSALLFLLLSPTSRAAETDNFTDRNLADALPDSVMILNRETNRRIQHAVQNTEGCDRMKLLENLRVELNRNPVGEMERFAEKSAAVFKLRIPFKRSIYHNAHGAHFFETIGYLAGTIKVAGHLLGTDKLGHFFSQGYEYFSEPSLESALQHGWSTEKGIYGFGLFGVFSYGDLNANFQGLRFWARVLDGKKPYVQCVNGRYRQVQWFSWADYVNDAMDEGLNCSEFEDIKMRQAVAANIKARKRDCAVDRNACERLVNMPCSAYLVNPACFLLVRGSMPNFRSQRKECEDYYFEGVPAAPYCVDGDVIRKSHLFVDEVWGNVLFSKDVILPNVTSKIKREVTGLKNRVFSGKGKKNEKPAQ